MEAHVDIMLFLCGVHSFYVLIHGDEYAKPQALLLYKHLINGVMIGHCSNQWLDKKGIGPHQRIIILKCIKWIAGA